MFITCDCISLDHADNCGVEEVQGEQLTRHKLEPGLVQKRHRHQVPIIQNQSSTHLSYTVFNLNRLGILSLKIF